MGGRWRATCARRAEPSGHEVGRGRGWTPAFFVGPGRYGSRVHSRGGPSCPGPLRPAAKPARRGDACSTRGGWVFAGSAKTPPREEGGPRLPFKELSPVEPFSACGAPGLDGSFGVEPRDSQPAVQRRAPRGSGLPTPPRRPSGPAPLAGGLRSGGQGGGAAPDLDAGRLRAARLTSGKRCVRWGVGRRNTPEARGGSCEETSRAGVLRRLGRGACRPLGP